jgi:hypothetical protein
MITQYGITVLENRRKVNKAYINLNPDFKKPRLYEPLRIRLNKSKPYIAEDHVYRWNEFKEAKPLKELMRGLPEYMLEVGYEFGVEVVSLTRKQIYDKVIDFRRKRIRIQIEDFMELEQAGCYEPGARLVTINNRYLLEKNRKQYNPIAYFMGKAFQHAILSNPNLLKVPEHLISYDNRFLPYYVIRYALRKGRNCFSLSVEEFLSENRWQKLKEEDRPMFRFLEMLFGKHKSTIQEEELTGIEYIH